MIHDNYQALKMKYNFYFSAVIAVAKIPIALLVNEFIQAVGLIFCSLSSFATAATRNKLTCLLLKSVQVEQIQRFAKKRTVKHSNLSKLTEGATSTLTTLDLVVGRTDKNWQYDVAENEWPRSGKWLID